MTSTPPTMEREPLWTAASTSMPSSERTWRARSALRTAATTVLLLDDESKDFTICLPTFPEAPKTATASRRGGGGAGAVAEEEEELDEAGLELLSPASAAATTAPRPTRTFSFFFSGEKGGGGRGRG